MSTKPTMVVVLPARPPIDKLVAYKRVQLDREDDVRLEVAFCDVNEPTPMHLMVWGRSCSPDQVPYLLDVGSKKYHKIGSSAAEVEKMLTDTENTRIYNRLVDLINENNRTGKLKGYRHSIAKLIREAYHVMANGDLSQEVVFDHGMDVVNAFFFPKNQREWSALFTPGPQYLKLKELWDGFNVSEAEILPFTLPLYFKQLFMSGRKEAEIVAKISWWLDKAKRVENAQHAAKKNKYVYREFRIHGMPAGFINVRSYFEAGAAQFQLTGSGRLIVGIFRNELGLVQINSSFKYKGIDFSALYAELDKREPGRWYYEQRFNGGNSPMLMNGSSQFIGVSPTSISENELIRLACTLIKFNKKP